MPTAIASQPWAKYQVLPQILQVQFDQSSIIHLETRALHHVLYPSTPLVPRKLLFVENLTHIRRVFFTRSHKTSPVIYRFKYPSEQCPLAASEMPPRQIHPLLQSLPHLHSPPQPNAQIFRLQVSVTSLTGDSSSTVNVLLWSTYLGTLMPTMCDKRT